MSAVDWLFEEGLLGERTTLAHMIFLSDREVERVGETRTGVAYCPISHEYIGLGVMRLRDLRDAGAVVEPGSATTVPAGIGRTCSNKMKQGDPVAARTEPRFHRLHAPRRSSSSRPVKAPGTSGRGPACWHRAGSGGPGRRPTRPSRTQTPSHRTVATVVYAARPSDVEMTIVGGRIVVEGGRSTTVDGG